jgi:hypothetical protein
VHTFHIIQRGKGTGLVLLAEIFRGQVSTNTSAKFCGFVTYTSAGNELHKRQKLFPGLTEDFTQNDLLHKLKT